MVSNPDVKDDTKSFPALDVTIVLCAPKIRWNYILQTNGFSYRNNLAGMLP